MLYTPQQYSRGSNLERDSVFYGFDLHNPHPDHIKASREE